MIFWTGTPRASAASWQNMVSAPVPMSVAPMSRLKEASSFIFREAAPMSTPGMPEACITMAMPTPRRTVAAAVAGHAHHGQRMRPVGARVLEDPHLERSEAPVAHAALDRHDLRVPRAGRRELLLARVLEADGPARAQGQHPAEVLDQDLL